MVLFYNRSLFLNLRSRNIKDYSEITNSTLTIFAANKIMKPKKEKEEAIDEVIEIIQKFQYNNEVSEKYKREFLDQDKIYDWQSIYIRE